MATDDNLDDKINKITNLISKLNNEKNVHKMIKTQQTIKKELGIVEKSVKHLRKIMEDSDEESCDDNSESDTNSETNDDSDTDNDSLDSEQRMDNSFSNIKSKVDKIKSDKLSIEKQIKYKKQLQLEIKSLIKLLKHKKMNIVEED